MRKHRPDPVRAVRGGVAAAYRMALHRVQPVQAGWCRMNMIKDWWRGYSDDDLDSILNKLVDNSTHPGRIIPVTERELRAHHAFIKKQFQGTEQ
jgi:hypothetical protein